MKAKNKELKLLAILILSSYSFGVFTGYQCKINGHENKIEIAFEAAAQQYKNVPHDTTRFDLYGTERVQKGASKYVLPKNARTEAANPAAPLHEKSTILRKRD